MGHSLHNRRWPRMLFLVFWVIFGICITPNASWGKTQKPEPPVLYIYNWAHYLPEPVLRQFEAETGIHVLYDVFDSPEILEAKLLAARSGYDVVFPSAWPDLARQMAAGVYLPLDFSKIPFAKGLDQQLMKKLETADPGNRFSVPYLWGTTGFVIDVNKVQKIFPNAPVNSLKMLFDDAVLKKLVAKGCWISLLDAPNEVFQTALLYMDKDPISEDPKLLNEAVATILKIRPMIAKFDSSQYVNQLTTGLVCVAQAWSSYGNMAKQRAAERGKDVRYVIPKEGSFIWFDLMAIPRDAPHPNNAHKFINFILRPDVIAKVTNLIRSPNAVPASKAYIDPEILADDAIYPPPNILEKLRVDAVKSRVYERKQLRAWTKVKTGY